MQPDPLFDVRKALEAGNKKAAQRLLRPLLNDHPTAEMWRLAAQACTTNEKAIECLHRAVALEPNHDGANRLLAKLESLQRPETSANGSRRTSSHVAPEPIPAFVDDLPSVELLVDVPVDTSLKKVGQSRKKRSGTRAIFLLSLLLFGMCCSLITMNMVGVISGPITALTMLTGGATPVTQIDGVPLSEVEDAPLKVVPAQTEPLTERDTDVLEPGYEHEYTFTGTDGVEMAIYVQFLSLAANRVSRNVVVLRPDDSEATDLCERNTILQGDNNLALTCVLDADGVWKVRILGRDAESVGAYFVGIEQMGA